MTTRPSRLASKQQVVKLPLFWRDGVKGCLKRTFACIIGENAVGDK
jgi:hypothetical protein